MKIKSVSIFIMQLFFLWVIHEVCSLLVQWLRLPIPGNVLGMIVLFILLMTGVVKLAWIDKASSFLLKHLVFFFIPITVGIMTLGNIFIQNGFSLLLILIASGVIGMIATGYSTQIIAKKREGGNV